MKKIIFMVAAVLITAMPAMAQTKADIHGHVTDQRRARVAGAEVRLHSLSGPGLIAVTNDDGAYEFKEVIPGDYVLEMRAKGFSLYTSNEIHVLRGQSIVKDVSLSIEAVNENVVVTANGTPQSADETSKAITTVEDQSIEARRELTVAESVRGVPGLRVQQQGSPGALTTLRVRGQRNFDTAILFDGLRLRDASDINGSAVSLITDLLPVGLDRLEVLRGSGSSIYGTNAIGGVINLVPRTGAGDSHFEFGFDGGSLALFREQVKGSGGLGKRGGYSFGVARVDVRRGVDRNDEYGNSVASTRWQFTPRPNITLSANFYGTISNARLNDGPVALPAAFTSAATYPAAIEGSTFHADLNNPDEGRRNRVFLGSFKFAHQLNDKISYTLAYQHVGTRRRNYNGPQIDPGLAEFYPFGDFEFLAINNGGTDTLDGRSNLRFGRHNLATAGFEYEQESIFQSSLPSFSSVNNTTDRQTTLALFGQDQISLLGDRLLASFAARSQWFRIRAADRPGFLGAVAPRVSITGDGSIAYFFRSTGTKVRAHAGNGFRAPSLFERFGQGTFAQVGFTRFGDPTLRAEESISVDAGIDQRIARDRARFGATWFYTHLRRVIAFNSFFVEDPLGVGRFSGYENRPGGISRGIETYFEGAPFRGADWRASYTFTNSDRLVAGSGVQPEYVIPRHLFGLVLTQRYRSFVFSFDLNRTGAYLAPVFENNFPFRTAELTFSGYTKADFFAGHEHRLSEKVSASIFAGVDNVFNAKYFENGFRAPGTLARGGISLKF